MSKHNGDIQSGFTDVRIPDGSNIFHHTLVLFLVILLVELVMEENRSLPQTVRRMVNNAGGLTEKGKILLL